MDFVKVIQMQEVLPKKYKRLNIHLISLNKSLAKLDRRYIVSVSQTTYILNHILQTFMQL